jgi:hypothetical protein
MIREIMRNIERSWSFGIGFQNTSKNWETMEKNTKNVVSRIHSLQPTRDKGHMCSKDKN